ANRLARGFDVDGRRGDRAPDPLCDLEGLFRWSLRQEDREFLSAKTGRYVVVAQLRPERLRDALEYGVAGEMAVGVVDVAQKVEIGHDQRQRPFEPLRTRKLLRERCGEVASVEETGLGVDARLLLQLRHAQ